MTALYWCTTCESVLRSDERPRQCPHCGRALRPMASVRCRCLEGEPQRVLRPFAVEELLLLGHLWRERETDTAEAARLIQRNEAAARRVLERLVESDLVEGGGHTRARRYHLSATVYREVGQRVEYVRRRGFDWLQVEQMILDYVHAHGRITRREVMDLCRVNANQAAYLLRRLVQQGKLSRHGVKRGAYYTLVERDNMRKE